MMRDEIEQRVQELLDDMYELLEPTGYQIAALATCDTHEVIGEPEQTEEVWAAHLTFADEDVPTIIQLQVLGVDQLDVTAPDHLRSVTRALRLLAENIDNVLEGQS